MDPTEFENMSKNMRQTGMLLFRDALIEASQGEKLLCVVHAAHAAEILLKARIAQEHPLLIFSKLPKANSKKEALTLVDLVESGRTFSYDELPDQLWATTGIKIKEILQYREFGRLRNQIIHFSRSSTNMLDILTIRYSLEVLDPLVESFWGKSVIYFIKEDPHDPSNGFVSSGLFEDSIRKAIRIDERLRNLLGDRSREAWERMRQVSESVNRDDINDYSDPSYKIWEGWHNSTFGNGYEEACQEWEDFLNSF